MDSELTSDRMLRQEILKARERVYHFGSATPLERLELEGVEVWVKREDLSPIKAYKWRGASNRMAALSTEERKRGVVTASAGNHAQGVALAARLLEVPARVFMPLSTPSVKRDAVRRHGGDWVEIRLEGDSYDEALAAARADQAESGAVYIHAYDDLLVMAGQGTLADEVVMSGKGPFDAAYLQIGGGGMAAGVSEWLKTYWPEIEIVGVEGEDQASMVAAMKAGRPVRLDQADIFCDGTAVREVGQQCFDACRRTIDRLETVSNVEVIRAIRAMWEGLRCVAEPSGAMGLAQVLKERESLKGKRVLVILCGANVDFLQLGHIASSEGASPQRTRSLRVRIAEQSGTMLGLLDSAFADLNISDFQYGKTDDDIAWPAFTVSGESTEVLEALPERLRAAGYEWEALDGALDVGFRAIALSGELLQHPLFLKLEFYERTGALHDFLKRLPGGHGGLCYFNYRQTGERIGRALIGLDFAAPGERSGFLNALPSQGKGYRLCEPLDEPTVRRLRGLV